MSASALRATAYLLVTHGSRDPRPAVAAEQLAHHVSHYLSARLDGETPSVLVGTACLELAATPLHQQIVAFCDRAREAHCTTVAVLPLFLSPGVHVKDDIPSELEQAQQTLSSHPTLHSMSVQVLPYLGSDSHLMDLLTLPLDSSATLLLAHGSRRPGGNQPIEAIAQQINAIPAYWSVEPMLAQQVEMLIQQGHEDIRIQPYFLFEGGLTDAIAQQVNELRSQYPAVQLSLGEPLGNQDGLAPIIAQCIEQTMY